MTDLAAPAELDIELHAWVHDDGLVVLGFDPSRRSETVAALGDNTAAILVAARIVTAWNAARLPATPPDGSPPCTTPPTPT